MLLDQFFFLRSGRNRVDLLSHESETTDKREQYDCRADKKLDGSLSAVQIMLLLSPNYYVSFSLKLKPSHYYTKSSKHEHKRPEIDLFQIQQSHMANTFTARA